MKKKNGFTLIELIAVLVILAILALIVTPLVMNIIRKAKVSADKRSIDAYGRSIELAIAGYLMDTGDFPTSIGELTIEYSGSEVVCETTQLNPDSSVYLDSCTVDGRSVDYSYGTDNTPSYTPYTVGDQVSYNSVNYYVIKDSGKKEDTVTLLKAEPLTVAEVNLYGGVGTDDNHVNKYTDNSVGTAADNNGYGGMAYCSSTTCNSSNRENCTVNYAESDVKYVVDAWKQAQAPLATEARLITYDELTNLGEIMQQETMSGVFDYLQLNYNWLFKNCWTMTSTGNYVWYMATNGGVYADDVLYTDHNVRPVIIVSKTAL